MYFSLGSFYNYHVDNNVDWGICIGNVGTVLTARFKNIFNWYYYYFVFKMNAKDLPGDVGEGGQDYPPWFAAYLDRLQIQDVSVGMTVKIEMALEDLDDVSSKFKHDVAAAYQQETQIEEARKKDKEALAAQLQRVSSEYEQGCKARKVYCSLVYSPYILKPVLSGRN